MRKLHTRKGGFTLIELMIVVAIIGILAAIAIPNFLQFQLRSKTGEAKTNIAAIRTAEEGYFAEFNNYVTAAETPGTAVSTNKRLWTGGGLTQFDQLGWSPTGEVFYNYGVDSSGSSYTIAAGLSRSLHAPRVTTSIDSNSVRMARLRRGDRDGPSVAGPWAFGSGRR